MFARGRWRSWPGPWRIAALAASAGAAGFLVFARVLRFGFAYDDAWTIVQNQRLDGALGPLARSLLAGTAGAEGLPDATRPAMVVSLWLDRHGFGLRPFGYHLHSLLLYAAVCALAALTLLALSKSASTAFTGGLFFAAAPVHAEVVAAPNYREDLLAAAGVLVALLLLLRPCADVTTRSPPTSPVTSVAAGAAFALGLLAKESAVALVLFVAVVVVILRLGRRWALANEASLVAIASVGVVWASWRFGLPPGGDDIPRAPPLSPYLTLLATARFEVRAVTDALFPVAWSPEHVAMNALSPWWLVIFSAMVVALAWLARRRAYRRLALGVALALAAALPCSPLAGPANQQADRYLFLAVLGGTLVWGNVTTRAARQVPRRFGRWLPALVVLPLALLAQPAASAWADDATLWSVAVARAPRSPRAWAALSRIYRMQGKLDAADAAVGRALALEPSYLPAQITDVYNRLARGDVDTARAKLDPLRAVNPRPTGLDTALRCAALPSQEAQSCIDRASRPPE